MKWLTFALGVLMVFIGASCIVYGYPIVEVERGWTLTISGAAAMSGGAIVLALGLAVARIEGLSAALQKDLASALRDRHAIAGEPLSKLEADLEQVAAAVEAPPPARPEAPPPARPEPSRPRAPRAAAPPPPFPGAATGRPVIGRAHLSSSDRSRFASRRPPDFLKLAGNTDMPPPEALESARAALAEPPRPGGPPPQPLNEIAPDQDALSAVAPAADLATLPVAPVSDVQIAAPSEQGEAARAAEAAPEAAPESPFKRFPLRSLTLPRGAWPEPPVAPPPPAASSPPAEEPAAVAVQEEARPAEAAPSNAEDWFDRALADLDEPQQQSAPLEAADVPAETGAAAPSAGAAIAEEERSAEAKAEEPAVIGRYETEGVLYVMFADGSIEAQSASGVFRFESLAALRTHIEGQG